MEGIIIAVIGGIFSLIAAFIGKKQEGTSGLIIGLLLGVCITGAVGFGVFLSNKEQKPEGGGEVVISEGNGGGETSGEDSGGETSTIDDSVKKDNEENIKISKEDFNAKNEYKIIWASNTKNETVYEELKRMENIVKPYVGKTSIDEVHTGKYSLVIDSGNGRSIEYLEVLKDEYNKKLQNIASQPENNLKYQIDREPIIYIENKYIDDAILDIKREYNNGNYDKSNKIKQDLESFILNEKYSEIFKHYKDKLNII